LTEWGAGGSSDDEDAEGVVGLRKKEIEGQIQSTWSVSLWKNIMAIAKFLNGLPAKSESEGTSGAPSTAIPNVECSSKIIDFRRNALLVGTLSSKYAPILFAGSYKSIKVPFDTEYLHFDLVPNIYTFNLDDLTFQLVRPFGHAVHINGENHHTQRVVHADIHPGARYKPAFSEISKGKRTMSADASYNQVYNNIAIKDPKVKWISYDTAPPSGEKFKIKIFAQIGPGYDALKVSEKPPVGELGHDSKNFGKSKEEEEQGVKKKVKNDKHKEKAESKKKDKQKGGGLEKKEHKKNDDKVVGEEEESKNKDKQKEEGEEPIIKEDK